MSEPTSHLPTVPEWDQPPQPGVWVIPPPRQRWWIYVLFLLLTFFSTMVVGARMEVNFQRHLPVFSLNDDSLSLFPIHWIAEKPANLLLGVPFSLTLMFILFAHEMGHYLYARYYRVYATPPFFVPFPSLIGTLGAFIRIKSPIPSRAALFDIGIAGPIAGFVPACIALLVGLSLSHPITGSAASDIQVGFPFAFHLAALMVRATTPLSALSLHPIAAAAWVGMFATALNLLPGGQLDGGHIIYSISPRFHRAISILTILALVPLGKYMWTGWLIWSILLALTMRHPRVPKYPEVRGNRRVLAICAAVILALSFTPAPIAHSSGREVWPGMREGARESLHDLRDGIRHELHRK
ncbi:MAG TPA: site-2 protease family protein [Terriglobales bacterium]|nr:site-2 protease family protein [Terriglobales bacterium]